MDPSDIIVIPFPLHELCRFVASSLAWGVLVSVGCRLMRRDGSPESMMHGVGCISECFMIGVCAILVHIMIVLCGVHPALLPLHTLVSALYVALNILLPVFCFVPMGLLQKPDDQHSFMKDFAYNFESVVKFLLGSPTLQGESSKKGQGVNKKLKEQQRSQLILQYAVLGTFSGVCVCAILRILDHGMQIQRYPTPILIGATWGRCVGLLFGEIVSSVKNYS